VFLVIPFCPNYVTMILVSLFFGLFISAYISLTSIILVDLLGLDKLTNAFGLLILFRGAASIVGAPLAGSLYDSTGSYDTSFFIAGALILIAALISFFIPCVKRCYEQRLLRKQQLEQDGMCSEHRNSAVDGSAAAGLSQVETTL